MASKMIQGNRPERHLVGTIPTWLTARMTPGSHLPVAMTVLTMVTMRKRRDANSTGQATGVIEVVPGSRREYTVPRGAQIEALHGGTRYIAYVLEGSPEEQPETLVQLAFDVQGVVTVTRYSTPGSVRITWDGNVPTVVVPQATPLQAGATKKISFRPQRREPVPTG
jgi:hypothetical protein